MSASPARSAGSSVRGRAPPDRTRRCVCLGRPAAALIAHQNDSAAILSAGNGSSNIAGRAGLKIANNLGYRSIYGTLDSLDGVEPAKKPQFLVDRVTSKNDAELDGAIILMHVGVRSTADALPAIIANLQGRGFRLVTISKLLESASKSQ